MHLQTWTKQPALGGELIGDWTGIAEGWSFSYGEQGPREASGFVPMSPREAASWARRRAPAYLELGHNAKVIWAGRLEEARLDGRGISVRAFGGARALDDLIYSASISESSYGLWQPVTNNDQALRYPERYVLDRENRLYFAPRKNEAYTNNNHMGTMALKVPEGGSKQFVSAAFSYEMLVPSGWTLRLISFDTVFGSASVIWTLTSTGVLLSGSTTQTFSATDVISFTLCYQGAGTSTITTDTGDRYAKVTGLRIKTSTASTFYDDELARDMLAAIRASNPDQLRSGTGQITSPGVDRQELRFEDQTPGQILAELASRGNGTLPYTYGVDELLRLYYRAQGDGAATYYVDAADLTIATSLDDMHNSVYASYTDARGQRKVTSTSTDSTSVSRYGITRQQMVSQTTTSATEAATYRDVALADSSDPAPRASINIRWIYDQYGALQPLYKLRPGDILRVRNIDIALDRELTGAAAIRVAGWSWDLDRDEMSIETARPQPALDVLLANQSR